MNSLRKFTFFVVVFAATAGLAAGQKSFKSFNINVDSTVYDRDTAGNSLLTESDGGYPNGPGNGAGYATYTTTGSSPAHPTISSIVSSSGGWMLYLGNQTQRTIWLTLGSQGVPIPDGYYYANVEIYSQCFDGNGGEIPITSIIDTYTNCSLGIDFSSGGTKYKLVMSPKLPSATGSNIPQTGSATVACTNFTNSCTSWTIVPNDNAANLYEYTKRGLAYYGQYQNTYKIAITE